MGNLAGIDSLTGLCGKLLAIQSGSTQMDLIHGRGEHFDAGLDAECQSLSLTRVDLRTFESDQDAVEALATGEADTYIGSDFMTVDRHSEFELSVALRHPERGRRLQGQAASSLWHRDRAGVDFANGSYVAILEK